MQRLRFDDHLFQLQRRIAVEVIVGRLERRYGLLEQDAAEIGFAKNRGLLEFALRADASAGLHGEELTFGRRNHIRKGGGTGKWINGLSEMPFHSSYNF